MQEMQSPDKFRHNLVKVPLSPACGGVRKIPLNLPSQRETLNFPPLEKGD